MSLELTSKLCYITIAIICILNPFLNGSPPVNVLHYDAQAVPHIIRHLHFYEEIVFRKPDSPGDENPPVIAYDRLRTLDFKHIVSGAELALTFGVSSVPMNRIDNWIGT